MNRSSQTITGVELHCTAAMQDVHHALNLTLFHRLIICREFCNFSGGCVSWSLFH